MCLKTCQCATPLLLKVASPHNIQAYRLVLKSLQMKGCVKHQNMQMLVKLPPLYSQVTPTFRVRRHETTLDCGLADRGCANHLNLVQDFIELRILELDSGCLDDVNYLRLVTSLMQACDEFRCAAVLRRNGSRVDGSSAGWIDVYLERCWSTLPWRARVGIQ